MTKPAHVKTSDGITAYVAGGLGNQLFILAAAWEQSRRLGCPLYLNTSYLRLSGLREMELNQIDHPGTDLGTGGDWTSRKFPKNHILPFPRRFSAVLNHVHLEKDQAKFDDRINTVKPGSFLVGYFQSERYFPRVAPELRELIESAECVNADGDYLRELQTRPAVTLHLRRGDYTAATHSDAIMATVAYARRALRLLRESGNTDPIRVFSDSPDLIASELSNLGEDFELADSTRLHSGLSTLRAMSLGSSMIMSNSSFSWWAAWLMDSGVAPRTVIAPRPWNETGTARADMLRPHWITLDARD